MPDIMRLNLYWESWNCENKRFLRKTKQKTAHQWEGKWRHFGSCTVCTVHWKCMWNKTYESDLILLKITSGILIITPKASFSKKKIVHKVANEIAIIMLKSGLCWNNYSRASGRMWSFYGLQWNLIFELLSTTTTIMFIIHHAWYV